MFPADDPRSKLLAPSDDSQTPSEQDATVLDFLDDPPVEVKPGARTWIARGAGWVIAYTDVKGVASFLTPALQDEHVLILLDKSLSAVVSSGGVDTKMTGGSVAVVPPGVSSTEVAGEGRVVRVFTAMTEDLTSRAMNRDVYAGLPAPNNEPLERIAVGVRVHDLDVEGSADRFGRIFTTSRLMVNLLVPRNGRRDATKLSPHSHADFEQGSLVVSGRYIHHLRWPWGTNAEKWLPDKHLVAGSPSLTVIPPTVVHTSEAVGQGMNMILDIFAPPRADWIAAGWVLNGAEYKERPAPAPTEPVKT